MTKLGFLGAMNRDVVVHQPAAALSAALGIQVPPLLETAVSDAVAASGVDRLQTLGADVYLGGSAFNAARVLASLNQPRQHDMSFFGIAGMVDDAYPHLDALVGWGVSTSAVERSSLPPATCLAMVEPAGRTLLTAHGANLGIATWLERNADKLARDIAECDVLHITSFLDPATPGLIAGILERSREINPSLTVSLDPGMAWIASGGDGLARLMRAANVLHLNSEEFGRLGGFAEIETIAAGLAPGTSLVVTRTHLGAVVYERDLTGSRRAHSLAETPLPPASDIRDATGAGDTFCGGFLWAWASKPTDPLAAARFGFALARAKIALDGPLTDEVAQKVRAGAETW